MDADAEAVAGGVYVIVDGRPFPALYGTRHAEVAERFDVPAYEHSGFEREIPLAEIRPGSHELAIVVVTNYGRGYYPPERTVALEVE